MKETNRPGPAPSRGSRKPKTEESAGTPVADDTSRNTGPFDVRTIKDLVALMSRHDLSEIDLREGDVRIRLRRGQQGTVSVAAAPPASSHPAALAAPASAPPAPAENPKAAKAEVTIKSPTPGTFYASPSPDADAFVKVGSKVTPTTVVCVIEAMKIFNEITADCSGVITEVLAENQQAVEYGQVLFKVDPTA
jgi:acetyl-CoA carboxylase biotin carboxyl carrier protein